MFAISDNRDTLDSIDVKINDKSYDPYQLGIYNVEVSATDMFSNTQSKVVQVEVVDKTAPELKPVGKSNGYVVNVEVNGSKDITIMFMVMLLRSSKQTRSLIRLV